VTQEENAQNPEEPEEITHQGDKEIEAITELVVLERESEAN
jgi:hypothetical protein